jgi:hypothetical protein
MVETWLQRAREPQAIAERSGCLAQHVTNLRTRRPPRLRNLNSLPLCCTPGFSRYDPDILTAEKSPPQSARQIPTASSLNERGIRPRPKVHGREYVDCDDPRKRLRAGFGSSVRIGRRGSRYQTRFPGIPVWSIPSISPYRDLVILALPLESPVSYCQSAAYKLELTLFWRFADYLDTVLLNSYTTMYKLYEGVLNARIHQGHESGFRSDSSQDSQNAPA